MGAVSCCVLADLFQVRGLVCSLAPGDSLLIPAYWFLHCQLEQPQSVSLTVQLHPLPLKLICPGKVQAGCDGDEAVTP